MIGVIIVDDDVEILQGLKGFIPWEANGFQVVGTAADGRRALDLVRTHRPRLLIADITMPAMDGLSLIRESLRVCPELKSIILTCHEDFAFAQEAISLGVMDYLLKITLTPAALTGSLLRVREAVGREPFPPPRQVSSRAEIQSALLYMQEHPGESIRCEALADRVHLSTAYFSRLFKKEVGMTFTDYLLRRRIEHARELLATTRMSVEEITWSVGLENASYFHRAFKKLTGLTPRQARGKS